jgi:N-acetyl-anhydromuramyl-L-alanine amidase AmpD
LQLGAGTASLGAATLFGATPAFARGYPPIDFEPASTSNYTASSRPRSYSITYVVIHVTQETYADTLRLFADPKHKASSHYVVRSADGHLAQCVQERNIAWHAGNWAFNCHSIGVEHEGWIDQPKYFTDKLYATSAKLVKAVCDKYAIPVDRKHIIGHSEVPGTTHTDPGPHWDWSRYISLVKAS